MSAFSLGELADIHNDPNYPATAKSLGLTHIVGPGSFYLNDLPDGGIDYAQFLAFAKQAAQAGTYLWPDIERYPAAGSRSEIGATIWRWTDVINVTRPQVPGLKIALPLAPQADFDPDGRFPNQLSQTHANNQGIAPLLPLVDALAVPCYWLDSDPPAQREQLFVERVTQLKRERDCLDVTKPFFVLFSPLVQFRLDAKNADGTPKYPVGFDFNQLWITHDLLLRCLNFLRMLGIDGAWMWYADYTIPNSSPPLMPFAQSPAYQAVKDFSTFLQTPIW